MSENKINYREIFEERAAIMEYEGGLSREKAERFAWEYVLELKRNNANQL